MVEIHELLRIMLSWPVAIVVAAILLRGSFTKLVNRLVDSESGKAKVGPVEIELGQLAKQGQQAITQLNRITYLMAESRLLELEITEGNFGPIFSDEQRERMKNQIAELQALTLVPSKN